MHTVGERVNDNRLKLDGQRRSVGKLRDTLTRIKQYETFQSRTAWEKAVALYRTLQVLQENTFCCKRTHST